MFEAIGAKMKMWPSDLWARFGGIFPSLHFIRNLDVSYLKKTQSEHEIDCKKLNQKYEKHSTVLSGMHHIITTATYRSKMLYIQNAHARAS